MSYHRHCIAIFLTFALTAISAFAFSSIPIRNNARIIHTMTKTAKENDDATTSSIIRVAHIGNSIQYYNDCPRLLQQLLEERFQKSVVQDSCLRGGATLISLLEKGNGMAKKFASPPALRVEDGSYDIGAPTVEALLTSKHAWDFVILNDHTQSPVREETKNKTLQVLKEQYVPMLMMMAGKKNTTVIFLQTAAYRKPVKESDDLGSFDAFTSLLHKGYLEYINVFPDTVRAKLAPVGRGYQFVKQHHPSSVWEALYASDDFHPSPHGTLLAAYVLYCTMVQEAPPMTYSTSWWERARYMQPPDTEALPLPTEEEAQLLRQVACTVCEISSDDNETNSRL
jgi:hypothetical protein